MERVAFLFIGPAAERQKTIDKCEIIENQPLREVLEPVHQPVLVISANVHKKKKDSYSYSCSKSTGQKQHSVISDMPSESSQH